MNFELVLPITHILVPQGAEYQAVKRGLVGLDPVPQIIAIPMGISAINAHFAQDDFKKWFLGDRLGVLLLGLGGGLDPALKRGDRVIYQGCNDGLGQSYQACDLALSRWLSDRLPSAQLVQGLTCDRVICRAREKAELFRTTGLNIVDMEGQAILSYFNNAQIPCAIMRIISDEARQSLPDLNPAIAVDGSIHPWRLAQQFAQKPLAAAQLIRSSLVGLRQLRSLAHHLADSDSIPKT